MMKKVIVIVGPTGSGKTSLSIKLAQRLHAEIINGDSVQVYKGLDIGSAKIKDHEKMNIKHHLLGVADPKDTYTVYHFQRDVRSLMDQIDLPMIVGGTGLYIKAALYDYEFVESERDLSFEKSYEGKTIEEIDQELLALDPNRTVDVKNRRRLLRSLEQALSGDPRSDRSKKNDQLYDALILYLDLDREVLTKRLEERLERQLSEGFMEEVKQLRSQNLHINAIGYRELDHYLSGIMTLEEAKAEIIKVSRKLAKKQKTWFKNQMHPIMMDAESPALEEDAYLIIQEFLKEGL
jgi:tRNA dimethylallyltransferase